MCKVPPFDSNVHTYSVTCPVNRSEPAPTKTTGEEMSSFHLRIAPGRDFAPVSRRTGNAPAVPVGGVQHIGWWHVPRRCWQYERRPMKVTVRLPSTFAGLAAWSPDRPSQSYAHRPGERCSRFVPQGTNSAASSFSVVVQIQGRECNGDHCISPLWARAS